MIDDLILLKKERDVLENLYNKKKDIENNISLLYEKVHEIEDKIFEKENHVESINSKIYLNGDDAVLFSIDDVKYCAVYVGAKVFIKKVKAKC